MSERALRVGLRVGQTALIASLWVSLRVMAYAKTRAQNIKKEEAT